MGPLSKLIKVIESSRAMQSISYKHFLGILLSILALALPACLLYFRSIQGIDHRICSIAGEMWPCGSYRMEWVIFGYVFLAWIWLPLLGGVGYLYRHEWLHFITSHQRRLPLTSLIIGAPTIFWFFQMCSSTMCLNSSSTLWLVVMIMVAWFSTMWLWLPLLAGYVWLEIIYTRHQARARRFAAS